MKNVLVLGAGMVSAPIVRYLLDQPGITVTMASRTVSKAKAIIDDHPDGTAVSLNVQDKETLEKLISESDIVVSLLPYSYHVEVATYCIAHRKHMVTTSYVSEEMNDLDSQAKKAGILILNECGLDPGIDHMSAMKIIDDVEKKNGKIISFTSTTGALPAHEANTNPFGYKFSWSPRGVLLASRNNAQWLEEGKIIKVPGEQLFEHYQLNDVPGVGTFENYPNRDSVQYQDIYGLDDAHTVYRGTFRMTGWCETMRAIAQMGWLSETPLENFTGSSYADVTRHLIGATSSENLYEKTTTYLDLKDYAAVLKRLEWLGLFSDDPLPKDKDCPLDYLNVLTLDRMSLQHHEKDMIVMHHEFIAEYKDSKERITSTLVHYGIPNGDTAVAVTVALPAAIAVKLILNNTIDIHGVYRPMIPDIYLPILEELEALGISFDEYNFKI